MINWGIPLNALKAERMNNYINTNINNGAFGMIVPEDDSFPES